ncbi:MAG TPA: glucodextranase DOMON-like domain-containing protein [Candidatus Cloacimonadota bacterium]|nr:glucodextranase DOMON-like domain-containing protein [Candidatus Cloacimonadota bacterium]
MKKNLVFVLFLLASLLWSGTVVVQFNDDLNDDYGDGNVAYPEHPMFTPGIFDIEQFRLEDAGNHYDFIVKVRGKIDYVQFDEYKYRYDIPDDFIFPLVQIYIDTDRLENSGITETITGVNAAITSESAWEKAVVFSAMPEKFRMKIQKLQPAYASRVAVPDKIYLSKDKTEMRVEVSKEFMGKVQPEWGYTVLMLGHDVTSSIKKNIYAMEVKSTASQFDFGGGHGALLKRYNSNIIDLIEPPFQSQKKILAAYDADEKKLTKVGAVYSHNSKEKAVRITGEVKQVSAEKVVINLGSLQGIAKGTQMIIASHYVVEADDVFPELCLAHFIDTGDADKIEIGMKAEIWKE